MSTLSGDWIRAVQSSSEFAGTSWDICIQVNVTTLDKLIEEHGEPVFCKIDVEGGELDVLRGLSVSLPTLSFEYITAVADRAVKCIDRLLEIGNYEYNWTRGEGRPLQAGRWLAPNDMKKQLEKMNKQEKGSGDIYARRQRN